MHDANHPEHQDRFERGTPDKASDPRKEAKKQGERYRRHLILLRSVAMRPLQRRLRKYRITKIRLSSDTVHPPAQLDHRISAMRAKTPVRVHFQSFVIPLGEPYHSMAGRIAAIHDYGLSSDERCVLRAQKQRNPRNLLGLSGASQKMHRGKRLMRSCALLGRQVVEATLVERRFDRSGTDAVDPNPVLRVIHR